MIHASSVPWRCRPVVLLFLLAMGSGVARSSSQEFRLFRFDQEAGSESFSVTPDPQNRGVTVTASSTVTISGRTTTASQSLVVDQATFTLREYRIDSETQGERQSVVSRRTADSVVVEVVAGEARLRRSFPARGDVIVLDNLVLNHLALLAMRTAQRGFLPETLQVVVPQVGALMQAAILPEPPGADGSRRIDVLIGSVTETIRLGSTGEIEEAEIPAQGLRFEAARPGAPPQELHPEAPTASIDRSIPRGTARPTRILFEEQPVVFDSKGTSLGGLLTLPRGGQKIPYPAVLFVHDEGAQDRDETLGPNRPFLEIARGLAVFGIASLRFDKRTLAAPRTIHPVRTTVQDEVIDDALKALETLRSTGGIDARRIWIVGHGLGGSLAPTIARADGGVAGLVILAGSLRPLDAILRDRLLSAGRTGAQAGMPVTDTDLPLVLTMLDSLAAGTLPDTRAIQGVAAGYYRDYRRRDLAGDFEAFTGPALLLFGGRDDRIRGPDIESWNNVIVRSGKKNSVTETFPGLGHLLIPSARDPAPGSLTSPGQVDPAVIERIAQFILSPP